MLSCVAIGCTNVDGGAVELSWHLEDFTGASIRDCTQTIDSIRLWWQVDTTKTSTSYPCAANHGVTAFDVPPGQALLWIEPDCLGGAAVASASFIAPAPIERTISVGDVVELHAIVVEIDTTNACK